MLPLRFRPAAAGRLLATCALAACTGVAALEAQEIMPIAADETHARGGPDTEASEDGIWVHDVFGDTSFWFSASENLALEDIGRALGDDPTTQRRWVRIVDGKPAWIVYYVPGEILEFEADTHHHVAVAPGFAFSAGADARALTPVEPRVELAAEENEWVRLFHASTELPRGASFLLVAFPDEAGREDVRLTEIWIRFRPADEAPAPESADEAEPAPGSPDETVAPAGHADADEVLHASAPSAAVDAPPLQPHPRTPRGHARPELVELREDDRPDRTAPPIPAAPVSSPEEWAEPDLLSPPSPAPQPVTHAPAPSPRSQPESPTIPAPETLPPTIAEDHPALVPDVGLATARPSIPPAPEPPSPTEPPPGPSAAPAPSFAQPAAATVPAAGHEPVELNSDGFDEPAAAAQDRPDARIRKIGTPGDIAAAPAARPSVASAAMSIGPAARSDGIIATSPPRVSPPADERRAAVVETHPRRAELPAFLKRKRGPRSK